MPTAVSSWREEMYSGKSPSSCGRASASQSGAQSEPGEAKMRSTPIRRSARSSASAPIMVFLLETQLGQQLRVAFALLTHVSGELGRRHRPSEIEGERLEPLEHHRLLHRLDDFAVHPLDRLPPRARRRKEAERKAARRAPAAL